MNKEKMQDIKERLDLFPDNMNKPAQEAYYELFDYIKNLEQALDEIEKYLKNDIESCNSALSNPEHTIINKHELLKNEKQKDIDILKIIQKAKGDGK